MWIVFSQALSDHIHLSPFILHYDWLPVLYNIAGHFDKINTLIAINMIWIIGCPLRYAHCWSSIGCGFTTSHVRNNIICWLMGLWEIWTIFWKWNFQSWFTDWYIQISRCLADESTLVQISARCYQETSHYQSMLTQIYFAIWRHKSKWVKPDGSGLFDWRWNIITPLPMKLQCHNGLAPCTTRSSATSVFTT